MKFTFFITVFLVYSYGQLLDYINAASKKFFFLFFSLHLVSK